VIVHQIVPRHRVLRFVPDHDNLWTEPLAQGLCHHKIPFRYLRLILDRVHQDEVVWVTIGMSEPLCRRGSMLRPGLTLSIRDR
jgi:hypothetical protein